MKKIAALGVALTIMFSFNASAVSADKQKLVAYTSMKESLIGKLRDAFVQKYPDVEFDYYSAGAGKLMAKLAAERESGAIAVDVLWTSEIPDFYQLKNQGMLESYVSEESKNIVSPVKDPDGYFTPARLELSASPTTLKPSRKRQNPGRTCSIRNSKARSASPTPHSPGPPM